MSEIAKAVLLLLTILLITILLTSIAVTYLEARYTPRPIASISICDDGDIRVAIIRAYSSAPLYLKEISINGTRYVCPLLKIVPGKENIVVLLGEQLKRAHGYVCAVSGRSDSNNTVLVFLSGRITPEVHPCYSNYNNASRRSS